MDKLRKIILCLFIGIGVVTLALTIFGNNKDASSFKEKSKEKKIKFLNEHIASHKASVTKLVDYFVQNWNQEKDEVKAKFCELMGTYRAKEAVTILVKNFDFVYYGDDRFAYRPRTILEGRFALKALAQIGTPALEPTAKQIYSELEKLTSNENTRHRIHFLRQALKYLSVEILGEQLAILFLENRIENKDTSKKLKEELSIILGELKQIKK